MKARYKNMKRYIISKPVSQPNDSGGKIFTPETFMYVAKIEYVKTVVISPGR